MKNTKTTLMELTKQYRSILRRCAFLNAAVLMSFATATPALANDDPWTVYNADITIQEGQTFDFGEKYNDYDAISVQNLTMSDGAKLQLTDGPNNTYIDAGTFAGTVDFSTQNTGTNDADNDGDDFNGPSRRINVTNATLSNVDFIGYFNEQNYNEDDDGNQISADRSSWENYNGLQANSLRLNGRVTIKDADVSMQSESVKGEEYFEKVNGTEALDLSKKYAVGTEVSYNGGLYQIQSSDSFMKQFYHHLATSNAVELVTEAPDYMHLIALGTTYKAGDFIQVVNTIKNLREAGIIGVNDYKNEPDNAVKIVVYKVKEGKEYKTLAVKDTLTLIQAPTQYNTSVKIESGSFVKLDSSNLAGEGYLDPIQRLAEQAENDEAKSKYSGTELKNKLQEIEDKYYALSQRAENLDIQVTGSTMEIGNGARIGKETSNALNIENNSKLDLWGTIKDSCGNDYDDPMDGLSSIDHFGYNGTLTIDNSTINLYPNSAILRSTAPDDPEGWLSDIVDENSVGNVLIKNKSEINMYGSTKGGKFTALFDGRQQSYDAAPAVILAEAGQGNLKITDSSSLNVYGDDNQIYVANAHFDTDINKLKENALYVSESTIDVKSGAKLSVYHYGTNEQDGTNDVLGGTIALDQGGTIDLKGTLEADVTSLTPSVKLSKKFKDMNKDEKAALKIVDSVGTVNFYDGGFLNGTIYGTNVNIKENTTIGGDKLNIAQGSVLNLGTKLLTTTALSSKDSIIETSVVSAEKGGYGALNVGNLTFDNSLIRINVDMNLQEGDSIEIPFLTGDTTKLTTNDFFNTMYDFKYKDGTLTLTRNHNSGMVSLKDLNDQLTASSWLSGGFSSGSPALIVAQNLSHWQQTDPKKFEKAVKQLRPGQGNAGHQNAGAVNQNIATVIGGLFNGPAIPPPPPGGPAPGSQGAPRPNTAFGDTFNNAGMWVQGLYNHAKFDGSNGYTGKTKGVAMGMDAMMTDNLKLGVAYAYTTSDIDATGSNTDVDTHTGILYGEYIFGNAFVNAIGTYGYSKYDAGRSTLFGKVTSDYHMDALYGQVMTGYNFKFSDLTLTPETGMRYLWTKTHGYDEKLLDQHISSSINDTVTGVLGGRANIVFATEKAVFTPELKLTATYDLHNEKGGSSVHLANGSSYVVEGESLKRFGIETGAKIGMTVNNMDFSLSYEGRFKKDYSDHTGMFNFRYNF